MRAQHYRNGLLVGSHWLPTPPADTVGVCLPPGIGDVSWVYSKLRHLPETTGRKLLFATPAGLPQRSHQLVELLPDVAWAGYDEGMRTADVFRRKVDHRVKAEDLEPGRWHCLSVNEWLEYGKPLSDWLGHGPTDYHFSLPLTEAGRAEAAEIVKPLPESFLAAYVSNRGKDAHRGWALWSEDEWADVLAEGAGESGVLLLGAEYDRDRSFGVAGRLQERGVPVATCLGRSLSTALRCLELSGGFIAYPSGIGILANVLRVPGLMLLPEFLKGLEETYADPDDLRAGTYRAWANPAPGDAIDWLRGAGLPALRRERETGLLDGGGLPALLRRAVGVALVQR